MSPFAIPTTNLLLALLIAYFPFFGIQPLDSETYSQAIQWSARYSGLLFVLVFAIRPINQTKSTSWANTLLKQRRYWGISFALAHLVHLSTIIVKVQWYHNGDFLAVAPLSTQLVSLFLVLCMMAMLFTSNNWSIKKLGAKRWKTLHVVCLYLLALSFTSSFLGKALDPERSSWVYWSFSIALLLIWALRVSLFWSKKASQNK